MYQSGNQSTSVNYINKTEYNTKWRKLKPSFKVSFLVPQRARSHISYFPMIKQLAFNCSFKKKFFSFFFKIPKNRNILSWLRTLRTEYDAQECLQISPFRVTLFELGRIVLPYTSACKCSISRNDVIFYVILTLQSKTTI